MKKIILLIFALLLVGATLVGCTTAKGSGNKQYKITVVTSKGATVTSQNPVTVKDGGSAEFTVTIGDTYAFRSINEGTYDVSSQKLTFKGVDKDIRVNFEVEDLGYDTTKTYKYSFWGNSLDTSSQRSTNELRIGTRINVFAGDYAIGFAGWTFGKSLKQGGQIVSTERSFTFDFTEDIIDENGELKVIPNYTNANVYFYDPNGGTVDQNSVNMTDKSYYVAQMSGDLVSVAISEKYYNVTGCASTFYDDGTFYREGYVLTEYNTKADGSGVGYSLGSKFPLNLEGTTLYCIWSQDSAHTDFTYEDVHFGYAKGVTAETAPHWVIDGIMITSYAGNDDTVVIPESIDGKTVTAIAAGAFTDKDMTTLVLNRRILNIADGAFVGCDQLTTIYYPDSIFKISNEALDEASYSNLHNFYVNATMAPRYSTGDGSFAIKFARLISNSSRNRIIVLGGSSSFQGLSTEYMQALLKQQYLVVNFGTTRTTHGYMYLEAMQAYCHEGDIILYAPENSAYMMGEPRLYWKTLRDMEGMYNIFRYIDIANYENFIGAFCELNRGDETAADPNTSPRYQRSPQRYEQIINRSNMNSYGEYLLASDSKGNVKRGDYCIEANYSDVYVITFNNRMKSRLEGNWQDSDPTEDYYDPNNEKWCSIDDPRYKDNMNRVIELAQSSGAKVYFSFCPVDADKVSAEAKAAGLSWFEAYDNFILDTYVFDGILGSSADYVFAHEYFYDNAFHPNDYGRTYRTYTVYMDICELLGITDIVGYAEAGTNFAGCLFESGTYGTPIYQVEYLK